MRVSMVAVGSLQCCFERLWGSKCFLDPFKAFHSARSEFCEIILFLWGGQTREVTGSMMYQSEAWYRSQKVTERVAWSPLSHAWN
jgi:hypothetical protein